MPSEVLRELQEVSIIAAGPIYDVYSGAVTHFACMQCYEATDIFSNGWLTLTKEILHKVSQM